MVKYGSEEKLFVQRNVWDVALPAILRAPLQPSSRTAFQRETHCSLLNSSEKKTWKLLQKAEQLKRCTFSIFFVYIHWHFRQLYSFSVMSTGRRIVLQLSQAPANTAEWDRDQTGPGCNVSPQLPRKAQGCCSWSLPASLPFRHFLQPFYYFLLFYHDIYSICLLDLPGRVIICSSSVGSYTYIYVHTYIYICMYMYVKRARCSLSPLAADGAQGN